VIGRDDSTGYVMVGRDLVWSYTPMSILMSTVMSTVMSNIDGYSD
jgi:hypothetical protein